MAKILPINALKNSLTALKERFDPTPRRVLAIAADGCSATGAVIRRIDAERLEIEALASSQALKYEAAAEDIVASFKAQGVNIPKQAILLTTAMLPAVLELPIATKNLLPPEQMLETLRWELEPLFAQLSGFNSLGSLLFARGHISAEQRQTLLAMQAESRKQKGRLGTPRFGELAVAQGAAKREQVEECLALQEELQNPDTDMLIGWHPQPVGAGSDAGRSAWLCAALSPAIRMRWVGALEKMGLHVLWIYPLAGASAPFAALSGVAVGFEWHTLMGVCYRQQDGVLTQLRYRQLGGTSTAAEDISLLAEPLFKGDGGTFGVFPGLGWNLVLEAALQGSVNAGAYEAAEDQPAGQTRHEVFRLADSPELQIPHDNGIADALLAALAGATAHALGLAPAASAVRLPGSRPPPPLYQRPPVWGGLAATLLLTAGGAFELHTMLAQRSLLAQQQQLFERQAELESAKAEIELSLRAEEEVTKKLKITEAELKNIELRKQLYERAFGQRSRFMETLLDALTLLAGDELLLKEVAETGWQQVEIQGFALNVEAVYRYARAVAEDLKDFGIKLGDLDTGEALGPMGLTGHRFSFVLLQDAKQGRGDEQHNQ